MFLTVKLCHPAPLAKKRWQIIRVFLRIPISPRVTHFDIMEGTGPSYWEMNLLLHLELNKWKSGTAAVMFR